jgi:hypothetical protein
MSTPSPGLLNCHFHRKLAVSLANPDFPGQTGIFKWCGQEDSPNRFNLLINISVLCGHFWRYPHSYPHPKMPQNEDSKYNTIHHYRFNENLRLYVAQWQLCSPISLMRFRMSSAFHTVQRIESLMGFGKRPDLTPAHHDDFPTGITLNICGRRTKPVSGMSCILNFLSVPLLQNLQSLTRRSLSADSAPFLWNSVRHPRATARLPSRLPRWTR